MVREALRSLMGKCDSVNHYMVAAGQRFFYAWLNPSVNFNLPVIADIRMPCL